MTNLLLIFFCLLPFSHFLFIKLDCWHAQGHFFQLGVLVCFCWSLFKGTNGNIKNPPIALLTCWLGLTTWFWWYQALVQGQYNFQVFAPFFNFLCFILLYKCIISLKQPDIEKILRFFTYVVTILLGYAILQKLNLDQFYKSIEAMKVPDLVVGTIGNPSHFATYLAMCLPLFYRNKTKLNICCVYLTWLVIYFTGSASGLMVAFVVTVFYFYFQRAQIYKSIGFMFLVGLGIYFIYTKHGLTYLNPEGRVEIWKGLFPIFQNNSIIGIGLGKMNLLAKTPQFAHWRHVHSEPYQLALETGMVGFGIVVWGIYEYFKRFWGLKENQTACILASIFLGGLVSSLVSFPCHLYLPGAVIMFSYAGLFTLGGKNDSTGNQG